MVPSEYNSRLAERALDHIGNRLPDFFGLRSWGRNAAISLLDDHLREAMMCVVFLFSL